MVSIRIILIVNLKDSRITKDQTPNGYERLTVFSSLGWEALALKWVKTSHGTGSSSE